MEMMSMSDEDEGTIDSQSMGMDEFFNGAEDNQKEGQKSSHVEEERKEQNDLRGTESHQRFESFGDKSGGAV